MRTLPVVCCLFLVLSGTAQRNNEFGFALTNGSSAFPFSTFAALFQSPLKPGFELTYGFNWKTKRKHDWYQQVKAGYFYHRFVQHGIPLYTNFGYRYKFSHPFSADASFGAGYLQSIPATEKFKLGSDGEYKNNKGLGRIQAVLVFNIGARYVVNPKKENSISIFVNSQQRIQTPFVKSYVPFLPYNVLMIGAIINLQNEQAKGRLKRNQR